MLKHILILFAFTLTQISCSFEDEQGAYRPIELTPDEREVSELEKRELLQIEDIKIGSGSIAASGRRIIADITVLSSRTLPEKRGPTEILLGKKTGTDRGTATLSQLREFQKVSNQENPEGSLKPALFMKVRCESVRTRSETGTRSREVRRHTRAVCRRAERRDCQSQPRIRACSRSFMNNAG